LGCKYCQVTGSPLVGPDKDGTVGTKVVSRYKQASTEDIILVSQHNAVSVGHRRLTQLERSLQARERPEIGSGVPDWPEMQLER